MTETNQAVVPRPFELQHQAGGLSVATAANARAVLGCFLLFVTSVLLALFGWEYDIEALRIVGGFGVVVFGLGAAPVSLIHLDLPARLTVASLIGLSVLLGVGALMADVRLLWHPQLAAVLLVSAAFALHLAGLARANGEAPRGWATFRATTRATTSATRRARSYQIPLLLIAVGTALWLIPAITTRDPDPGVAGLLTKISPVWYAGNLIVLFALVLGRARDRVAGPAVISLVLSNTITPALVYGGPTEQSAAKHMHMVEIILSHHHIVPSAGIYQAYSALFAGIAWLCGSVSIRDPFTVATYWPVLVGLITVIELRLLVGQIVHETGRRWIAVALVSLVSALGQTYFSPQSVGYVMAFGVIALLLPRPGQRPLSPRATTSVLLLVSVVLALTHELSPYVAAAVLFILAIFKMAHRWEPLLMAIPALAWAVLQQKVVGHSFSFAQLFDITNFRPPSTPATPGLQRLPIVGLNSHALLLGMLVLIVLAARGFFTNVRQGWAWAYGLSTVAGLGLIVVNPYGNEGIFRASLFAIPWLAVLAVVPTRVIGDASPRRRRTGTTPADHGGARTLEDDQVEPSESGHGTIAAVRPKLATPTFLLASTSAIRSRRRVHGYLTTAALMALFTMLFATFCVANYGMDGANVLRRSEMQVAQYFVNTAPAHSALMPVGQGDSPATQPLFDSKFVVLSWPYVVPQALVSVSRPVDADVAFLEHDYLSWAKGYGVRSVTHLYLYWTSALAIYQAEYGIDSRATMEAWLTVLKKSRYDQLVFHSGTTYLFRFKRPQRRRGAGRKGTARKGTARKHSRR